MVLYSDISQVRGTFTAGEGAEKVYDKARNLMLSDITHDIKTPITTICGYAKTLTDGVIPLSEEKRQEYLQAIYAKSMRMSELVTMLLNILNGQ